MKLPKGEFLWDFFCHIWITLYNGVELLGLCYWKIRKTIKIQYWSLKSSVRGYKSHLRFIRHSGCKRSKQLYMFAQATVYLILSITYTAIVYYFLYNVVYRIRLYIAEKFGTKDASDKAGSSKTGIFSDRVG